MWPRIGGVLLGTVGGGLTSLALCVSKSDDLVGIALALLPLVIGIGTGIMAVTSK